MGLGGGTRVEHSSDKGSGSGLTCCCVERGRLGGWGRGKRCCKDGGARG